jgi:hypothetical protein
MLCMRCVSALAMCCAASEIERCVIVMVQLYCCVFTFDVFVGDGWMALVPTRLPHLRALRLSSCHRVRHELLEQLVTAAPHLFIVKPSNYIVGPPAVRFLRNTEMCEWRDAYD